MTRHKMVNGEKINLTAEEETARDAEEAQANIDQQAFNDAETAATNKKASQFGVCATLTRFFSVGYCPLI